MVVQGEHPYVLCIDVGGPNRIGWADSLGQAGTGTELGAVLDRLAAHLAAGGRAALGFEAPIWTPVRSELSRITASRGGIERAHNRAWSAGAGTGALGAALGLMPWCLTRIGKLVGPAVATTVRLDRFHEQGGLLLWEAFISASMKVAGTTHHDDARLACEAFAARWPDPVSDIPAEPGINHAVSAALVAGLAIEASELVLASLVIGASGGAASLRRESAATV